MKITTLDLDFQGVPGTIAAFLVEGPHGVLLVECGPGSTLPVLKERLHSLGLAPADITDILVTHIHLDHAGAAGWWARQGARIYVHERGAPHLIDPSRLLASAGRIYGDQMQTLWGELLPAPADRVVALSDGDEVKAVGLELVALDTPGHASHHHVFRLDDVAFTGDATGIRLPGSDLVDVPAPPPEFDLELWLNTLALIRRAGFSTIYPTHFGPIAAVEVQLEAVEELLRQATEFIRQRLPAGPDTADLEVEYEDWFTKRATARGVSEATLARYAVANPPHMSVKGIVRYWRRRLAA